MPRFPWILSLALTLPLVAKEATPLPPELSAYKLDAAPKPTGLLLRKGDRLAICGDSITEQKRYSVIMESYLTASLPELEITSRQYGWSGEQAGGFLGRMENDVLRFKPTIATTCYGMNDFRYVPFQQDIADQYEKNEIAIAEAFEKANTRVILGSSGIIDSVPGWVKSATGTKEDLNLSLSKFRNITLGVAKSERVAFADVYTPMLVADLAAKKLYGEKFQVSGSDGVHPGWAGQVIMAYAFLKGMGIDGDIGTITYSETGKALATTGHEVLSVADGKISLRSTKLPFSAEAGDVKSHETIAAGRALIPFDDELNRFILKVASPKAAAYTVTWGETSKRYTAAELKTGVNLAKDFQTHPLSAPFKKIWDAVAAKQAYETEQIKSQVHGEAGKADMEGTFAATEKIRDEKVAALNAAKGPVEHAITIVAEK